MSQEQEYQDAIRNCLKMVQKGGLYPNYQLFMDFDGAKCRVNIGFMVGGRNSLSVIITDHETNNSIWTGPAPNNIDVIKVIVTNNIVSSVLNS